MLAMKRIDLAALQAAHSKADHEALHDQPV
jgi:hypothetical protein